MHGKCPLQDLVFEPEKAMKLESLALLGQVRCDGGGKYLMVIFL